MPVLEPLVILEKTAILPIIQGGMGVNISTPEMAAAVAANGGIGVISATLANHVASVIESRPVPVYEAVKNSLIKARGLCGKGLLGINIMVALPQGFEDSIAGAIAGGVDFIFLGAGLPLNIPKSLVVSCQEKGIGIIPIVSSARAMRVICSRWLSNYDYLPPAVVLEGPLAGGHLGFKNKAEILDYGHSLESVLPEILAVADEYRSISEQGIKVIVGGGVLTADDIYKWLRAGADGVQMGTIFVASRESGASVDFKKSVLSCSFSDIALAHGPVPASPCGLPFRVIESSPGYLAAKIKEENPPCVGYLCGRDSQGRVIKCPAIEDRNYFCICNGLLSAIAMGKGKAIFTVGARAAEVKNLPPFINLQPGEYPPVSEILKWLAASYAAMP